MSRTVSDAVKCVFEVRRKGHRGPSVLLQYAVQFRGFDKLAVNYLATVKLAILQLYLRKLAPNDSSDRP